MSMHEDYSESEENLYNRGYNQGSQFHKQLKLDEKLREVLEQLLDVPKDKMSPFIRGVYDGIESHGPLIELLRPTKNKNKNKEDDFGFDI